MNELFKRVVKGSFDDPPSMYSRDLKRLIKSMVTVQPDLRPSCSQILQSREVSKAIRQYQIDVSKTIPEFDYNLVPKANMGLATITNPTVNIAASQSASKAELMKTI